MGAQHGPHGRLASRDSHLDNKRLADHPSCSGFVLDGVLNQLNPETGAGPTWELGTMRGDAGPSSHDCLDCLERVIKDAQRRFTLE